MAFPYCCPDPVSVVDPFTLQALCASCLFAIAPAPPRSGLVLRPRPGSRLGLELGPDAFLVVVGSRFDDQYTVACFPRPPFTDPLASLPLLLALSQCPGFDASLRLVSAFDIEEVCQV